MIEEIVAPYLKRMEEYRNLEMKAQEQTYCIGMIQGLQRYGSDGGNEFKSWAEDAPFDQINDILYEWEKSHTEDEIAIIQSIVDAGYVLKFTV
jgi:hypothetical protein